MLEAGIADTLERAREPARRGAIYAWEWATLARAALEAHEALGDGAFLELVARSGDAVLADRDDRHARVDSFHRRVRPGWSHGEHLEGHQTCLLTHSGRIAFPLLRFAQVVRDDAALGAAHGERAARFRNAVAEALDDFDADYRTLPGRALGYYHRPTRDDVDPLNHQCAAAEALVLLADLDPSHARTQRVSELANWFRAAAREQPDGSWSWPYTPTPETLGDPAPKGEYSWKAAISILFPIRAHEHGLAFEADDLARIARTFLGSVHRDGAFQRRIDPRRDPLHAGYGPNSAIVGWMLLDGHAPEIRRILERAVGRQPALFPGGWFTSAHSVLAYAHRLGPPRPGARPA